MSLLLTIDVRTCNHSHTPIYLIDGVSDNSTTWYAICELGRPWAMLQRSAQTRLVPSHSARGQYSLIWWVQIVWTSIGRCRSTLIWLVIFTSHVGQRRLRQAEEMWSQGIEQTPEESKAEHSISKDRKSGVLPRGYKKIVSGAWSRKKNGQPHRTNVPFQL